MPKDEEIIENKSDANIRSDVSFNNKDKTKKLNAKSNKPFVIAIIIAGLMLIIAAIAVTENYILKNSKNENNTSGTVAIYGNQYMGGGRSSGYTYGSTRGVVVSTTETDITSGVVISVGDSSFVIAGNGEQYTVKTSSDTTYNNDNDTVKVNDSVTVIGDESDGTITATQVRILN